MAWLQENWIVAVVGLVVAVVLLWWLFGRGRPEEIEAPVAPSAEPKKPLEAARPEIIAAEPARFKPREPAPAPVAATPPPPPPAPEPVAEAPPASEPAPAPEPVATPRPVPDAEPVTTAKADNLQLLKGVGPKMVVLLNGLGVTRFQQIADWTDADVATIDPQLGAFQGRIARDNIVDQAGFLARGDKAGFEAKYGALGGEL